MSDKTFRDNLKQALEKEPNGVSEEGSGAAEAVCDADGISDGKRSERETGASESLCSGYLPADGLDRKIDVFLSYSSLNKNVADAVVAELEQHGIRCWYAPRDIIPGQEWVSAIHDAITACSLFVLIYTDSSNESKQVANEVALAFNSGKTLIPFRLSDAEMNSELEYYLTRVHWLDAVNPPLRQSIENLREYSERILRGDVPRESKVRNANAAEAGGGARFRWFFPALAVLAVAVVVAIVLLVKSGIGKNKPSGDNKVPVTGTNAVTPTESAITVTEPPTPTHSPEEDAKYLFEKAYDLQGTSQDKAVLDEAYECYMKTGDALTDDEKIIAAMFTLASFYYEEGLPEDAEKGLALYRKAAACGSVKANNFLGNYYLEADKDGKSEGSSQADTDLGGAMVSHDLYEAVSYYGRAAETGDAIALYSLGLIYENEYDSYTIVPDYGKALEYYKKAEQAGHAYAAKARERVHGKRQNNSE